MRFPPTIRHRLVLCALPALALACGPTDFETGSNHDEMSFEDFEASTYLEPFSDGVYIVNGDTPVENEKKLYEFWQSVYGPDALIVHRAGGADAVWSSSQKLNLTYCVSTSFGSRYNQAVATMAAAAGQWEAAANVNYIHDSTQDSNCNQSNNNVVFDVRPTSGASYLARAFFPDQGRSTRNVIIDSSAWNTSWTAENILVHELGHTLGFRHEHTRPEAGACFEDNNWRAVTAYDSDSTMHYPQCNGTSNTLAMTATDRAGAAAIYGDPSGGGGNPPPPPPPPTTGTPQSGSASGSVRRNQQINYQPLSVLAGSVFEVDMTGTRDADLYVRFGAQPTTSAFDCRPYLNGSNESCSLDVPAGESQAFISVRGWASGTSSYTINVAWVSP